MDLKYRWGKAIQAQRQLLRMTQKGLADAVGVDQSAVSFWESGAKAPSVPHQLKIANALRIDARVLFTFPQEVA